MKNLVIYDSCFGNTEKIAEAIAKSISAKAIKINDIKDANLNEVELIILGCPTHGGRPTEAIQKFINDITLKNIKFAVFDTRMSKDDINIALKLLIKLIGYASPKMAKTLKSKGYELITSPEGFLVKGKEGPLSDGEIERAKNWIKI
ncbi:MAG: flavodoxin family protein [Candidatus Pacebacteria bacterium]|jgi:flavodoxin|nr:flavodoxin family protein [Candidatus Paceibacterota bacterium]MDD2757428.1 flavodoxin family protein [Candidatus Paceibacterota bacterium]MDD3283804.1 flavodoxin family protein [Candidatus Paceibacterota bacterium]MDD3970010.1 flavodoxin family protein [Candidatus Paceibacterota bacterium]MDD4738076.1 flavodoxin family protein [Candidatus Paceibacterota bacterium]